MSRPDDMAALAAAVGVTRQPGDRVIIATLNTPRPSWPRATVCQEGTQGGIPGYIVSPDTEGRQAKRWVAGWRLERLGVADMTTDELHATLAAAAPCIDGPDMPYNAAALTALRVAEELLRRAGAR